MSSDPLKITDTFPDVSTLGRTFGFELAFRQLDGGDTSIPATALVSENIALTHMQFARRFHQLGLPPANRLTFGVPICGFRDWFGRRYRTPGILPFHQSGGIDGVSEAGFQAYTVSFTEDYLSNVAKDFQVSIPSQFHSPTPESIIGRGASNNRFREMLNDLFHNPDSRLNSESEEELIITLIQAAHNGTTVIDRSSAKVRDRAIRAALSYIAEHPDEIVTVRDICKACKIALRTLNRAFNERFGVSPNVYLNRQRLSAVRNELLSGPPGTQVSDVANRWGFWHLGQFARDYRRHFGELPSKTLKR